MGRNDQMDRVHELETKFSEIIKKHLERLAGPALPDGNFPVSMTSLACSVLLVGRENDLKRNESGQPFTFDDLLQEISGLGIPVDGDREKTIREMERAGFIRIQGNRSLLVEMPLMQLCGVLDEIFPRMQGINLVAYLVQTMEEAQSGRKGLTEALEQLDQVLEMQGVPLLESRPEHPVKGVPARSTNRRDIDQKTGLEKGKKADEEKNRQAMLRLFQAAAREERQKEPVSSSGLIRPRRIMPEDNHGKSVTKSGDSCVEHEPDAEPEAELPVRESPPEKIEVCDDLREEQRESTPEKEEEDQFISAVDDRNAHGELPAVGRKEDVSSDEDIEERIAAFEEELAMTCPLCGKGKIGMRETAKGKRFYKCSLDTCYFISWGKPHHLSCPRCRNGFLIEVVDAKGSPFLKCPRATCNYKQNLPVGDGPIQETDAGTKKGTGPTGEISAPRRMKKVVRRRLVRIKR